MKQLLKIMRSVSTSLLFILLILVISLNLIFIVIQKNPKLDKLINQDYIITNIFHNQKLTKEDLDKSREYIDKYIKYIFYKRSYPSFEYEKENINILKNETNIEYNTITLIRKINSFFTNGSLKFMMTLAIIPILLLMVIVNMNMRTPIKLLSISCTSSGLLVILLCNIITKNINKIDNTMMRLSINSILKDTLNESINKYCLYSILIGITLFIIITIIEKIKLKHTTK